MTKARDIASAAPAPSTVSATELGYLDGVSSAIQTQIDGKQAVNAAVSTTELGYLDGVTSAIQTQLDGKTAKNTLTTTGDIYYASSANTPARLGIGSTSQVLTVSGGVPTWAAPSGGSSFVGVKAYSSTTQSISNNTNTAITFWDLENFDTDSIHSTATNPSRFTVPSGKNGKWAIQAALLYDSGAAGARRMRVYKNGVLQMDSKVDANSGETSLSISNVYDLVATDYLEIYTYQSTGGTRTIVGSSEGSSFVSMYYLGA